MNTALSIYKVDELLTETPDFQVRKGYNTAMGTTCLIKQAKDPFPEETVKHILIEEHLVLKMLDHPSIVKIASSELNSVNPKLILEDNEGKLLSSFYRERPFSIKKVLTIGLNIAGALEYLHANGRIVQTLTPADILLHREKGDVQLINLEKRLPFRPEHFIDNNKWIINEMALYMSSDALLDQDSVMDPRDDIYTLGVILYELFFTRSLFGYSDFKEIVNAHLVEIPYFSADDMKKVPQLIIVMLQKMLAKKRKERFKTMAEVVEEIKNCLALAGNVDIS